MKNHKTFGKKVLAFIMVIVFTITPFSYVKADTYTIDDVYLKLRDILSVLNGYGQNIPTDGINDQIQDLQDLFDTIFVDNTYNYQGLTGLVQNQTFMDLMQVIADQGYTIPSRLMEGYYMRDSSGNLVHMSGLSEKLSQIDSDINRLNTNSSTIVSDLGVIITRMNTLLSDLLVMSNTLRSILTTDQNILNLETNFYNYIQNGSFKTDLDNVIDTISWTSYNLTFDGTSLGSYNDIDGTSVNTLYSGVRYYYFSGYNLSPSPIDSRIYLIKVPLQQLLPFDDFGIYYNNNFLSLSDYILYSYHTRLCNVIFFSFPNYFVEFYSNIVFYLKFNRSTYVTSFSPFISFISDNDIEYWELQSYFDLHQLLLDFETVNSSELDKLNQQNQNLTNTIQEFNTVETQITTDFSNNLVTFNSNLNNSTSMLTSLSTTVIWFSTQMQNVFDNVADFKILFILPMIFGIALWFIGRGGFILRNTGSHDNTREKVKKGG